MSLNTSKRINPVNKPNKKRSMESVKDKSGFVFQEEKKKMVFTFFLYENHCQEMLLIKCRIPPASKASFLNAILFLYDHKHQQVTCQRENFHLRFLLSKDRKPNWEYSWDTVSGIAVCTPSNWKPHTRSAKFFGMTKINDLMFPVENYRSNKKSLDLEYESPACAAGRKLAIYPAGVFMIIAKLSKEPHIISKMMH